MLKEQSTLFNRIAMVVDLMVLLLSFTLAYTLVPFGGVKLSPFISYLWILILVVPLWLFFLHRYQLYNSIRRLYFIDISLKLLQSQIIASLTLGFLIWILDKNHFSRSLFLVFIIISFILLLIEKLSVSFGLKYFRKRGYNFRNLLIVGTKEKAKHFHSLVEDHNAWGLKVIGFLQAVEDEPLQESIAGYKVLGYCRDMMEVCKTNPVDEVVFCLPKDLVVNAEEHLKNLEELGITVRMVIDFYEVNYSRKELGFFHNELPILTFHSKSLDAQQLLLKRLIDIVGSLVGLFILTFLFPIIALVIKKDSPGPLLFSQERVGESGRLFKCWKFRSMCIDAEERKSELIAQNEMNGAIFKIKDDPRITKVGKFLRKTSLDELPQFWNVLKGEMSLVGTRPPTPAEVEKYENWHRRRISIKPGITGMWQVSGRNNISDFNKIVQLDVAYIDSWNIWLDIKILLKTLQIVFTREGSS